MSENTVIDLTLWLTHLKVGDKVTRWALSGKEKLPTDLIVSEIEVNEGQVLNFIKCNDHTFTIYDGAEINLSCGWDGFTNIYPHIRPPVKGGAKAWREKHMKKKRKA